MFEGIVLGLKQALILCDLVIVDGSPRLLLPQGLTGKRLFADVVVAGHQVKRTVELFVDPVKAVRRILVGRGAGYRVNNIAKVNDEVRFQGIEPLDHIA